MTNDEPLTGEVLEAEAAQVTALVPVKGTSLQTFGNPEMVDALVARAVAAARAKLPANPDMTKAKDRDAVRSAARFLASTKVALVDRATGLTVEMRDAVKVVNRERDRMEADLAKAQAAIRQPLTDWETAEKARLAALENRLVAFSIDLDPLAASTEEIAAEIRAIQDVAISDDWQEKKGEAALRKDAALAQLRKMWTAAEKREADAAELARLRQADADREAAAAAAAERRRQFEVRLRDITREGQFVSGRAEVEATIAGLERVEFDESWGDLVDLGKTQVADALAHFRKQLDEIVESERLLAEAERRNWVDRKLQDLVGTGQPIPRTRSELEQEIARLQAVEVDPAKEFTPDELARVRAGIASTVDFHKAGLAVVAEAERQAADRAREEAAAQVLAAEQARVAALHRRFDDAFRQPPPGFLDTSAGIRAEIARLEALVLDESWEELRDRAIAQRDGSLAILAEHLTIAEGLEAAKAEADRTAAAEKARADEQERQADEARRRQEQDERDRANEARQTRNRNAIEAAIDRILSTPDEVPDRKLRRTPAERIADALMLGQIPHCEYQP